MDLRTFLKLAKKYNDLGWAVQAQLIEVCDGADPASKNANAMKMCERFLTERDTAAIDGVQDVLEAIGSTAKAE